MQEFFNGLFKDKGKDKEIELNFLKQHIDSQERYEKGLTEKIKSLPEYPIISDEKTVFTFLPAIFEIYETIKHECFRSALFNIVCIIEFALKHEFEIVMRNEKDYAKKRFHYVRSYY